MIGEWTEIDKETKELFTKFTGRWKKKGKSIEVKGNIFEKGEITDQYTIDMSYDPELGVFVQKMNFSNHDPKNITKHNHWNPKQKIATLKIINPNLPPEVEIKQNWKNTKLGVWETKFELYRDGKLVSKKETIMTRKAKETGN